VNFNAKPQPGAQERAVIDRAFARLLGDEALPGPYRSPWFAAALHDSTARCHPAPELDYGRPRRTRGATRA
jgi:hypothetical protein